jgi:putative ABC transport system ATP-binding protein
MCRIVPDHSTAGLDLVREIPTPAVVAIGLHRRYRPDVPLLSGLDLTVAHGEWVAVMGPSGCGKSTLLQLLAGLDLPDAGTIQLAGHTLDGTSESARAVIRRSHVGYVFQFQNLVPHLSVRGNVELPLRLNRVPRRQARQRASEVLESVGAAELADARPASLSGGQAQRVALARAIANRPTIVFADEPTGALDTEATRQMLDVFRALHLDGQTIVMVTHDQQVAASADRVLQMHDGRFDHDGAVTGSVDEPAPTAQLPLQP